MISYFKKLFAKKPAEVGFSSESAVVGFQSKSEMLLKMCKQKNVSHDDLNVLSHMFFDVTFPKTYYKFRNANGYGMYFEISGSELVTENRNRELKDIILTLKDSAFSTTLILKISVKEIMEVMEPFQPDFTALFRK